MQIFLRNFRNGQRPQNSKCWIIIANTAGRSRFERRRNEIINLDVITERLEPMRKSLRDVELVGVSTRELELLPFAISRRLGPDVDNDVKNRSLNATQQLNFAVRSALVMHTP